MFFLQRALNTLYSDDIFIEPQPKQPRLIILPQDEGQREESSGEELEILGAASVSTETSSRRMLEAAGNHIATDVHSACVHGSELQWREVSRFGCGMWNNEILRCPYPQCSDWKSSSFQCDSQMCNV